MIRPPAPGRAAARALHPLYRDPVHDGAADPVVVWNERAGAWWMFYTNRRAADPALPEISWIHGTRIGIAASTDGGETWRHHGEARLPLPPEYGPLEEQTHWAPEIVRHEDAYHLYLSVVPGIFIDWQHPRAILHFTSPDLENWTYRSTLPLGSDRVIDACVARLADGLWRMWYNDERLDKAIAYADSSDLHQWVDRGLVRLPGRRPGEGPKVFAFAGSWWMVIDEWCGLAVYRSADAANWGRQPGENLLCRPGVGEDDGAVGRHADVVVNDGRAWLFYFTHPGKPRAGAAPSLCDHRRSSIHAVELLVDPEGRLVCDRDRSPPPRLVAR